MSRILLTCALGFALTAPAFADDPKPDPKAEMEAMMKAAAINDNHKALQPLIGEWEVTTRFFQDPSQPPQESKGTASHKWAMGGRFVHEAVKGDFGGMPFEGAGVVGYDNLQECYVFAWIDNFGTMIEHGHGQMSADKKVLTMHHEEIDPSSKEKKKIKGKDVTTFIDNDSFKAEFYKVMGDKDIKVMEVIYKRTK